jgi:hypothetical protein
VTDRRPPECANQRQQDAEPRGETALKTARRADADQLPHEQAEIEPGRVDQQPFANVCMSAEVHAAHRTRLIEMRKGAVPSARRAAAASAAPREPRMRRRLR